MKTTEFLEMIEKEALDRCAPLDTDKDVYVERFNKGDWIGIIITGLVFAVITAAGCI